VDLCDEAGRIGLHWNNIAADKRPLSWNVGLFLLTFRENAVLASGHKELECGERAVDRDRAAAASAMP
jgi:hypothetical protein